MADLLYSYEAWSRRAKVAEECAEELRELQQKLGLVVERNYFGVGCVEGQALFEALHALLGDGARAIGLQSAEAGRMASSAELAARAMAAADETGGRVIGDK